MSRMMRIWVSGTRANFLVLPVALVSIGGAVASHDGVFHPGRFLATLLGIVAAHISVNLFNEYSDWKTGIDARTVRTPFSGGSGNLTAGLVRPSQVLGAAWGTLALAFLAGVGLAWTAGWPVLVLMGIGGLTIIFYTEVLTRWILGELFSGLTLGSLVVIGAFFVQTGDITPTVIWAAVPPGILTALLLLLNEFPDVEADRFGGRRHMVIVLGKRKAAIVYTVLMACVYGEVALGVILGALPGVALVCLLTLPLGAASAYRAVRWAEDTDRLLPALGINVTVVLLTDFLLAAGFLLA